MFQNSIHKGLKLGFETASSESSVSPDIFICPTPFQPCQTVFHPCQTVFQSCQTIFQPCSSCSPRSPSRWRGRRSRPGPSSSRRAPPPSWCYPGATRSSNRWPATAVPSSQWPPQATVGRPAINLIWPGVAGQPDTQDSRTPPIVWSNYPGTAWPLPSSAEVWSGPAFP